MNKKLLIIISGFIALLAIGAFFTRNMFMYPSGDISPEGYIGRPVMPPHGNPYGKNFCNREFMKNKLALDENQIKAVEELNIKFDKEHNKYHKELRPLRDNLRKILKSSDPDMKEVRETLKQMLDIELEMRILRISQGAEISKIIPQNKMERLHHERRMMYRENFREKRNNGLQDR